MKEKVIQTQILQLLGYMGIVAYRINAGMLPMGEGRYRRMVRMAPRGFSDIMGVLPGGRALFIEVKAGKNKPTEAQQMFLEGMRNQGAVAFWANCTEKVEEELREVIGNLIE